jgi:lipoprotein NlpI
VRKCFRLIQFVGLISLTVVLPAEEIFSVIGLRNRAIEALSEGKYRSAIENADAMVRLSSQDPRTIREAADIYLRAGKCQWAVQLFDRYLKSRSDDLPELWQRGIALYFVGEYEAAARQFEVHRTVNPNDVENAAWHFLCVAKAKSPSEARAQLLPAPGDPRPPMQQVLTMLQSGNPEGVREKVDSLPADSKERESAEFYGDFYLGLYADAMGQSDKAKRYMSQSASRAPRNYMGDVARVYAKYLSDAK